MALTRGGQATQETVAAEVRAWMARCRVTGRRAAKQLGWTEVYLSRRLTGAVPFNVADLAALADLLGVPVTAFFESPEGFANILSSTLALAA